MHICRVKIHQKFPQSYKQIRMKKILLTLALLSTLTMTSQALSVDTNTYTVPQLVNTVLINSPCTLATNISWRTGTNFGSSNGLGFFTNSNPNFPMTGGVVLSTGSAMNAGGPNTTHLNDGAVNWEGDADLEATLAAAGIPMVSTNATVLEFDFLPISSNFNFEFVFASEEYGNFQCQFSDAFAFLLTNLNTGVTTNLAVVPNTNTPISVVTVRDFLYNSSCASANAQYFGSFNGGSAAASSATNFNGQTVMMNATSALIPNTPYHIKLVIADRGDYQSDSAIFISSNSFNIGQNVLGNDLTVANNSAICNGTPYELTTGLNAANYTFSWTKNGVALPGQTGASIMVTQPGTYGVTYSPTVNVCQAFTDIIEIEFLPAFNPTNPNNIYRCDVSATSYMYNLEVNTPIITGGSSNIEVSYHATLADAQGGTNALPLLYNSPSGVTIYTRIVNSNSGCFTTKTFDLLTSPAPIAYAPAPWIRCGRTATQTNGYFLLTQKNAEVLNGQSSTQNVVSYYLTANDATSGMNPITLPLLSAGQTIYVRVQNVADSSCFSTNQFQLVVNPLPEVDTLPNILVCENYVLPSLINGNYFSHPNGNGTAMFAGDEISETQTIYIFNQPLGSYCAASSSFTVTVIDPLTLNPGSGTYCSTYTLPVLNYGEYFTGDNGTGNTLPAGTEITETQQIYIHYISLEAPFCEINISFLVTIVNLPSVGTSPPNVFDCASYTLPTLLNGNYFTGPNGGGTELAPGTVLTNSQKIYIYSANTTCVSESSFRVIIGFTAPNDVAQCAPYKLPHLLIGKYYSGPSGTGSIIPGGSFISTTQTIYIYIPNTSNPDCMADVHFSVSIAQPPVETLPNVSACESFVLEPLTLGAYYSGPDATGLPLNAGDVITSSKTIYIYATTDSGCSNQSTFNVTINLPPAIDSRSNIDICNAYVLTQLSSGNYYTGPNGTGQMLGAGSIITESATIYIYAETATTPSCSSENSFNIFIFSVEADSPADVTACDSYVLPQLQVGNYFILPGGPLSGEGSMRVAGDVITESTLMYVYTESGERINCSDENVFNITINNTPVVLAQPNIFACNSYVLPVLTVGNYFTQSNGGGTMLSAGHELTENQTIYVYAETATTPNCFDQKSFEVTIFNVDEIEDVISCQNYVLPALSVGKYYTGTGGTGTMLPAGTVISTDQTIYIYAKSPFVPSCYDETSFEVVVVPRPIAYAVPAIQTRVCDEDGNNDGITSFNLTNIQAFVLGSQTGAEFMIEFFETLANANDGINAVTTTTQPTVYARVSNVLAPDCYALRTITITVNKLPEPTPQDGVICYDTFNNVLISPYTITSGLSASQHTFQWLKDNVVVGNGVNYVAQEPGTYTLIVKRTATGCFSTPVSVIVKPSEPAVVTHTQTSNFSDFPVITVHAEGTGNYVYQLDNGNFQTSNVFENVSSGNHIITVKDMNQCGETTHNVLVVNYPHYFTPNNDGANDTWNIKDLVLQNNSRIAIYDRYGKLLTQISPSGAGWDGTFGGKMMPSNDYWFVVTYEEDKVTKEFKAHFAMKR